MAEETMVNHDSESALSRAVIYNLFASLLGRKIDDLWLNLHFQNKLQMGIPESEGKTEWLASLEKAVRHLEDYQRIQLDYDALFAVPGPSLTFPYESCYTHRNADGSFGRLWQEPAQAMHSILNDWEIRFAEGWDLIPDHIAVELFFMGELCRLSVDAQEKDLALLLEWQSNFFSAHIQSWAFELMENVEHKAQTGFYRGASKLLKEFLKEEEAELIDEKGPLALRT